MKDLTAVRALTLLFAVLFMLLTRVHGTRLFFIGEGDDESYYSYARSLLIDRDLDFRNEPLPTFKGDPHADRSAARYAVGPGLLWLPFLGLAHGLSGFEWSAPTEQRVQALSTLHWMVVCAASILYGFAGYLFLYLFLRRFFDVPAAFWSTCLVGFSSPLLYYLFNRPLMSHSSEFFCLTVSAYLISGLNVESQWRKVILAAAVCGTLFLCRWMDAPYVAALGGWGIWRLRKPATSVLELTSRQLAFGGMTTAMAAVQLLVWRHLTGLFYPGIAMFDLGIMKSSVIFNIYPWTWQHFLNLWAGADWGILWISPILLLALPSLALWNGSREVALTKGILLIPTAVTFWIASNWPSHGGDYANRYLIPAWLFFAFLFAEGYAWMSKHHPKGIAIMKFIGLLAWSISLFMLTLFKSNGTTLTLQIGPTLYHLPSDWVNHRYALEAFHSLLSSPFFAVSTFGSSLLGYVVFRILGRLSLSIGPLVVYFQRHPAPPIEDLALMTILLMLGAWIISRLALRQTSYGLR